MAEEPYTTGGFICVTDMDGCRHALRLTSISSVRDAGEDRRESLIVLNGGRATLIVPASMETVLAEILDAASSAPSWGRRRSSIAQVVRLRRNWVTLDGHSIANAATIAIDT